MTCKLSKEENRYRKKLIAEYHMNKNTQKWLDDYVMRYSLTYKYVYYDNPISHNPIYAAFRKLKIAMLQFRGTVNNSIKTFKKFFQAVNR